MDRQLFKTEQIRGEVKEYSYAIYSLKKVIIYLKPINIIVHQKKRMAVYVLFFPVYCCKLSVVSVKLCTLLGSTDLTEGGLLFNGHLSKVGALLVPAKSILCLFKTLFFLLCVPDSYIYMVYRAFYVIFLLALQV